MSFDLKIRTCKICNKNKLLSDFDVCLKKNEKIYHRAICKICFDEQKRLNYPEKLKSYYTKYYSDNKKDILEKTTKYHKAHKEKHIISVKKYNNSHRQQINNKKKLRRNIDKGFCIRSNISRSIREALFKVGVSKNHRSCFKYTGYSLAELKEYLEQQFEPWMSWDNYGKYNSKIWDDNNQSTWTWNIDHIIPQSNLIYTSMEDDNFKKCWDLKNLRPYSAKQNLMDGVNRLRHGGKNVI